MSRRTPPPAPAVAPNAFDRKPSASAIKTSTAPPPPPPPPAPAPALRSVPPEPEDQPNEPARADTSAPAARASEPEPAAPVTTPTTGSATAASEHDGSSERHQGGRPVMPRDPDAELNDLVQQAVTETRNQNREAIPELIARLKTIAPANNPTDALNKLLGAVAQVPAGGKVQTPLEIAPHLHQKLKAEATANRARNKVPTMTGIVLQAIGEAHESGRLTELVEAHKAGERHNVPLFGQLVAGTAPRGTTLRMQFQPTSTAKIVAEILASWHQIDFVVLVRLALEDHYKPRKKSKATAEATGGESATTNSDADQVESE